MAILLNRVSLQGVNLRPGDGTSVPTPTPTPTPTPAPTTLPGLAITIPVPTTEMALVNGSNVINGVSWYRFVTTQPQIITVSTVKAAWGPDTHIGLYDSAGDLIGFDDDAGANGGQSIYTSTLKPAGTYYVAVGRYTVTFSNNFTASSNKAFDPSTVLNVSVS